MRIYYCGHSDDNDAISRLGKVATGTKPKKCGATAHHRCDCAEKHPDTVSKTYDGPVADHPKYLCGDHLGLYVDTDSW